MSCTLTEVRFSLDYSAPTDAIPLCTSLSLHGWDCTYSLIPLLQKEHAQLSVMMDGNALTHERSKLIEAYKMYSLKKWTVAVEVRGETYSKTDDKKLE